LPKAKEIEREQNEKRRSLFEAQDEVDNKEVDNKKERLISEIEARLQQKNGLKEIFTLRWMVR